jgi:hypothetical protein
MFSQAFDLGDAKYESTTGSCGNSVDGHTGSLFGGLSVFGLKGLIIELSDLKPSEVGFIVCCLAG